MTFAQVSEYESGKTFAESYARTYGMEDAMALVRRAAQPASREAAPAVARDVATLRQARVAGMCDALLARVQA